MTVVISNMRTCVLRIWSQSFYHRLLSVEATQACVGVEHSDRLFSTPASSSSTPAQYYEGREIPEIKTIVDQRHGILRISGSKQKWQSVIGLEVHAQISANTKLFSSAPTSFNKPVNSQVAYLDASIPGTLPVLNRRCVEAGIKTALSLGSSLNHTSFFDRKHYFYADLPAGYQITQQRRPLAVGGEFSFPVTNKAVSKKVYDKSVEIVQIQLEQDSGKSLHDEMGGNSLIDLNRCGSGLMEIVFGPGLRDGEEAAGLVKELALILECIDSCKGRMERGELRVDCNISVRKVGEPLGVRTEVKNLGSIRTVSNAIEYEVARQIALLEAGGVVENETRSFDFSTRRTVTMRDKEAKQDYRFMPEPNLPPLRLVDQPDQPDHPHKVNIFPLREDLPELPSATRSRLVEEFDLLPETAASLVGWPELLGYFQKAIHHNPLKPKAVANLVLNVLKEKMNMEEEEEMDLDNCILTPEKLVEISDMREREEISFNAVRELVSIVYNGDERAVRDIVEDKDLYLIKDVAVIGDYLQECLDMNEKLVKKMIKDKTEKSMKKFLGEVNKNAMTERIDMRIFTTLLHGKLEGMGKEKPKKGK